MNECPNCHLLGKDISPCKKCGTMVCESCRSVDNIDCMACVFGLKDFQPNELELKLREIFGGLTK